MNRPALLDALRRHVLLADGGMGSRVQALTLDVERDYWGRENCTDVLVLSRPDLVREIHRGYFAAGADMVAPSGEADTDAELMQLVPPPREQVVGDHTQQEADLLVGAAPVLGRESEHREPFQAELDRPFGRVQQGFFSGPVAFGACQPPFGGPPPVAVHDTGDVTGQAPGVDTVQIHCWQATAPPTRAGPAARAPQSRPSWAAVFAVHRPVFDLPGVVQHVP